MGEVGCLVGLASLLVGCLRGSVLKFDMAGVVKKNGVAYFFGLQVMIGGSICASDPFILNISNGT